ncbi:MAG: hypothetical protein WAO35_27610 [Terriglobia bacterium]
MSSHLTHLYRNLHAKFIILRKMKARTLKPGWELRPPGVQDKAVAMRGRDFDVDAPNLLRAPMDGKG